MMDFPMTKPTAIFASLLIFLLVFPASALKEEQKLENIQKELEQKKEILKKTKKEEQAVLGRLVVINKQLKKTKKNLYLTTKKIQANESQITTISHQLRKKQGQLQKKEKLLSSRVKEAYKNSRLNYLELLLVSRSVSDFLNRLYFFRKIVDYDAQLVKNVRTNIYQAKKKKNLLANKTSRIRNLADEIKKEKKKIDSIAQEKKQIYKSLKQRRKEYEAQIAELEKSSKDLELLILKKVAAAKDGKIKGSGKMIWPLKGRITSRFGYRRHPLWGGRSYHRGLDIAAKYGSPIKAADSGVVIFSGWWDGYGKAIVIDHGSKTTTVYGHMSRIYQTVGKAVVKGQVVGLVGSTGYSTGPHLHFEVRRSGKPVNPISYL